MKIVTTFDPSLAVSGSFNAAFPNSSGKMVVYNESNISIQLQWAGFTTYCPAWTAMLYCVSTPKAQINWSQLYTLPASGGAPLSVVVVEAYNDNEPILGTYPSALVRSTNIGNSLNLSSSITSIANDGNAANTTIVEATVAGDGASAVKWTNDAQFKNGDATHPGSMTCDNGNFTTDGAGNVFAGGSITLANSKPLQLKVTGGTARAVLQADGSNQVKMSAIDANNIVFTDNQGTTLCVIDGNGFHLDVGSLFLLAGTLSRLVYTHINSVTSTAAFVNHNLGTTPDWCFLIPNDGTLSNGNFNAYYEKSSMTSTQVKLQSNSVGGIPVGLIAVKL